MIIHSIRFKNILCFGAQEQHIDFTNKHSMILLTGRNGHGKSTIRNIVSMGWYLNNVGLKLSEIPNFINKNGFIEIVARSNGHLWKITSTYSPNKILIEKDGEEVNWGGRSATIKRWLQEAIDIPYEVFSNTMLMDVNTFKSFVKMSPEDARNIRDRIFDFYILNDVRKKILSKINLKEHDKSEVSGIIKEKESKIKQYCNVINEEKEKFEREKFEKLKKFDEEISNVNNELKDIKPKVDEYEEIYRKLEGYETYDKIIKNNELIDRKLEKLSVVKEEVSDLYGKYLKAKKDYIHNNKILIAAKYLNDIEVKKYLSALKKGLDKLIYDKAEYEEKLKSILQDEEYNSKINKLKGFVDNYNITCYKISDLKLAIENLKDNISSLNADKLRLEVNITDVSKKLDLYKKGVCPECGRPFDDADKSVAEYEEKLKQLRQYLNRNEEGVETNKQKLLKYEQQFNDYKTKVIDVLAGSRDFIIEGDPLKLEVVKLVEPIKIEMSSQDIKSKLNDISKRIDEINREIIEKENMLFGVDEIGGISDDDKKEAEEVLSDNKIAELNDFVVMMKNNMEIYEKQYNEKKAYVEKEEKSCENLYVDKGKYEEAKIKISEMNKMLTSINKDYLTFIKDYNDLKNEYSSITRKFVTLNEKKASLESQKTSEYLNSMENLRDKEVISLELEKSNLKKIYHELDIYNMSAYAVSDNGIKRWILKRMVPGINKIIKDVMDTMEIPLDVELDDNFKVIVKRYGQIASLASISTGQTKIIDTVILVSILSMLRTKYHFNLIFLDEIFSSIDYENRSKLLSLLREVCVKKLNINTILVNHSPLPKEMFDEFWDIQQVNGFSNLVMNQ